jgi:hypothetical protein
MEGYVRKIPKKDLFGIYVKGKLHSTHATRREAKKLLGGGLEDLQNEASGELVKINAIMSPFVTAKRDRVRQELKMRGATALRNDAQQALRELAQLALNRDSLNVIRSRGSEDEIIRQEQERKRRDEERRRDAEWRSGEYDPWAVPKYRGSGKRSNK